MVEATVRDTEGLSFSSAQQPQVVAVIPAHDEERFIASVVLKALAHVDRVIVVDDGSADETGDLAQAAGAIVLRLSENAGKAAALSAGFAHALRLRPRAIVTIDGDAQHDPTDIPAIAEPVLAGQADVVIGSRFLTNSSRTAIPQWRQFGQQALNIATNTLSGVHVSDTQSGFRAFSPRAIEALNLYSAGLSVESEMQFLFGPAGLRVVEVPITASYRDGNKRNPVVHGLEVVDALVGLVARRRPLAFFGVPGMILVGGGLASGLRVVHVFRTTHALPVGTTVFTSLLVMSGIMLATTALILHSMGALVTRIRHEIVADIRLDGRSTQG